MDTVLERLNGQMRVLENQLVANELEHEAIQREMGKVMDEVHRRQFELYHIAHSEVDLPIRTSEVVGTWSMF